MSSRDSHPSDGWLRPHDLATCWRDEPPPPPAPARDHDEAALCEQLRALARERYREGSAIRLILDELARLVGCRALPDPAANGDDPAKINRHIEALIADVEDLADAAQLAEPR
jgi:hypothetical protein